MVIYPPNPIPLVGKCIFLAGSIEQNTADNWQQKITQNIDHQYINILNPRRKDWDSSWKEDILNPNFNEQVNWELQGLERADLIVMYFDPLTKSPVSLLELGLSANSGKIVVCCPAGYWKKGNVDIVCKKYAIPQIDSLTELITYLKNKF
jgi:hypothetical protein